MWKLRETAPRLLLLALLSLLPLSPVELRGQEPTVDVQREILDSQRRLEEIRTERSRLQEEMAALRSRVRNVSDELRNIERQLSTSRSVLEEIQFQIEAITAQTEQNTADLVRAREQLRERNAILSRRLRDIYKRGPLHTVRVLLGADSFTDLLNRYRYLELVASNDQVLVRNVSQLEWELVEQDRELQANLAELDRLREFQIGEVAELRHVEEEHQRTLASFRSREREATTRLEQLEEDEVRLEDLVGDLDRRRIEEERRRELAGTSREAPSTLSTDDMGTLDWPVTGELIYRFGRNEGPDGTALRWNGIGIAAARGTPVEAVRKGRVVLAGPFEGYGPTVIVHHGEGFYTLYLHLEDIGVIEGRPVQTGQVVGTVGGSSTPEGPHIEFQVRAPLSGSTPQALDPLQWLRPRGN